jgi:hypothetical protein
MEEYNDFNLFEDERVTEFVGFAAEYCTFVENTNNFTKTDFVKKALKLFPELYTSTLKLPRKEDIEVDPPEKFVSEMDWNNIYDKVRAKLGYHDDYLDVYDPVSREEGDISIVSLADNFADIYQDLKDFSVAYGYGSEDLMISALWELIYNFEQYWGIKLLNALRVLHRIFFGEENLEEEEPQRDEEQDVSRNWLFEQKRKQSKNKGNEI